MACSIPVPLLQAKIIGLLLFSTLLFGRVDVGVDRLAQPEFFSLVEGKKAGLITNQTGVNSRFETTLSLFERWSAAHKLKLVCAFAPEHGLNGDYAAGESVASYKTESGLQVYSLHGATRRPTKEMLSGLDVLVYDIQDVGSRSYTFLATLCYAMEEAAKAHVSVIVLDRPNPLGGKMVDGPMLEDEYRSFVGYINVPYCHGMTIGELARFFNEEYSIGCDLTVVPMKGWQRGMRFDQTGLPWIPTSPYIPEAVSPFFYPATGLLGELTVTSIGIGYTLPFKVVAAPWINQRAFAQRLNSGGPEGVHFQETCVRPFAGKNMNKSCNGVLIVVTDWNRFNPIRVQYWIFDVLKQLYPEELRSCLLNLKDSTHLFYRVCGTKAIQEILLKEDRPYQKLVALHSEERFAFLKTRQKYLNPLYN